MNNEEIHRIVGLFLTENHQEIIEFYDNFFYYLKDLLSYKDIHLDDRIDIDPNIGSIENLSLMKKVIKIGLNTIGINNNEFIDNSTGQVDGKLLVNTKNESVKIILEKYFDGFIKNILLHIIFEYICNQNISKINNLNQFDLLPRNFIDKIDKFKKRFQLIHEENTFLQICSVIDKSVDTTNLKIREKSKEHLSDPFIESNQSIIKQLRDAIEQNLSALKSDITSTKDSISKLKSQKIEKKQNVVYTLKTNSHLDLFINQSSLSPRVVNIINVNKQNLVSYFDSEKYNLDLESILYILSIFKMLDFQNTLNIAEIYSSALNSQKNGYFHSPYSMCPDPISNYYGLNILLNIKSKGYDLKFDLDKQAQYLKNEMEILVPENSIINCYLIYAITTFNEIQQQNRINYYELLSKVKKELNQDKFTIISNSKKIETLYSLISLIKILTSNALDLDYPTIDLNGRYKVIADNNFHGVSISNIVKLLLIPKINSMYKLDETVVKKAIDHIKSIKLFQDPSGSSSFYWRDNKLALKMELRMLFWILLAFSQYYMII